MNSSTGFRTEADILVERILDAMEDERDEALLREMSGKRCAKFQAMLLNESNFFPRSFESSSEFNRRVSNAETEQRRRLQ